MTELKSCPFCGEPAVQIFNVNAESYVYGCYTIGCMGNAENNLYRYKTDREAINAWNRRADDDRQR